MSLLSQAEVGWGGWVEEGVEGRGAQLNLCWATQLFYFGIFSFMFYQVTLSGLVFVQVDPQPGLIGTFKRKIIFLL